jgi:two-component system chemotaxis response regulator CheY
VDFARLSNALYSVFELSKFLGLLTIIGREGYIYYWGDTVAKILIVDDSIIMRRNLKEILTEAGHSVVAEASDGKKAVMEYESHMPDLVTMDITMPVMNGIEAVKKIISKNPEAKIIMISALDQRNMVFEALENGASHYIVKPITPENVLAVIGAVLGEAQGSRDSI